MFYNTIIVEETQVPAEDVDANCVEGFRYHDAL